jgi:ABC-2 type transport system ATP-binding protein
LIRTLPALLEVPIGMIDLHCIEKYYGSVPAVLDLCLHAGPGQIVGMVGPNGAGKSTVLKILAGIIPPTSGRATIAGFDIAAAPLEAKSRLGYVPETPQLYDSLTASAFLDLIGALHHIDPSASRQRADYLLDLFEVGRRQRVGELSKGTRQKVVIAAALLHSPTVLVLDEPFDGLDPSMAALVKNILKELAQEGATILFSTHLLHVVQELCHRVCLIDKGRKIADGTIEGACASTSSRDLDEVFANCREMGRNQVA